jgi:hypothetical protein
MMNWKGCERKRPGFNLRYYPGICWGERRKTTKTLSQDSRSLGGGMNPGSPEYEAGVLTTRPRFGFFTFVLYGRETWLLEFREEHVFLVLENGVLRRIFGPKRDEVTGGWRRLHSEELHNSYSSSDIIWLSDQGG